MKRLGGTILLGLALAVPACAGWAQAPAPSSPDPVRIGYWQGIISWFPKSVADLRSVVGDRVKLKPVDYFQYEEAGVVTWWPEQQRTRTYSAYLGGQPPALRLYPNPEAPLQDLRGVNLTHTDDDSLAALVVARALEVRAATDRKHGNLTSAKAVCEAQRGLMAQPLMAQALKEQAKPKFYPRVCDEIASSQKVGQACTPSPSQPCAPSRPATPGKRARAP